MSMEMEQAQKAKRRYQQAAAAIREDSRLSDEGKRQALAREYARTFREVERLREKVKAGRKTTGTRLSAEVFGVDDLATRSMDRAALSVAYRDAQDRAAGLETVDEAMSMLARAERAGDVTLARAVATQALEHFTGPWGRTTGQAWAKVVNAHGEAHPSWELAVQQYMKASQGSGQDGLQESFAFHPGDPGSEFGNMPRESVVEMGEA